MATPKDTVEREREIVARWSETGELLKERRRAELAAQSSEESRQAAFDMLQLGGMLPPDTAREESSGLIEMQRIFARWRSRGRG
jgi:hypothetical protein